MELELRHLKVVCALADEGSVTKAAASLGLAQPALSAQLGRIEKALGGALFERDHRGVRSTALGDLVLARARVMLPAMSGLREEAARLASNEGRAQLGATTHVTIGASTGALLGGLIRSLAREHPDVAVATRASWSSDEIADMLVDSRVDFAVVGVCADAPPPTQHGLSWHVVTSDPVFVLLAEGHRLAGRDEIDLAELADEDWAAIPIDGCFTGCFAAACARSGFTPRAVYEVDAVSCIELVASGHAVALCQPTRELPGLATVPLRDTPLRWTHAVGWHPESAAAGLADDVVRMVTAEYQRMVARSTVYGPWLQRHPGFGVLPPPSSGQAV